MGRISHAWMPDAKRKLATLPSIAQRAIGEMVKQIVAKPSIAKIDRKTGEATYRRGSVFVHYTVTGKGTHIVINNVGA